jgi:hypothetical protein
MIFLSTRLLETENNSLLANKGIEIMSNGKSYYDFSISTKLTVIILLTNIAAKVQDINKTLDYDKVNMKIINDPETNSLFNY